MNFSHQIIVSRRRFFQIAFVRGSISRSIFSFRWGSATNYV